MKEPLLSTALREQGGNPFLVTSGWPVPDAPRSINIAADSCVEAGMIRTLAVLKGAEAENFPAAQEVVCWCRR